MALAYLLDGYNIVKRVPELAGKSLEAGRETLVQWIELYRPQGSAQNSVTIIFDGRPGMSGFPRSSNVKVLFTEEESADEKIKRMVNRAANPKAVVVVTNDKDIRLHVRPLGAKILTVEEFLAQFKRPPAAAARPRGMGKKEDEKYISETAQFKITSEFEALWLRKGSGDRKRSPGA